MSKSDEKTLFLVDGSAIAYRAYFAFIRNPLINSKGENTSASFGFVNSLVKILRDENPDYLAVVFDTKAPTFRHKRYDEYKSTRAKMPDDMVSQLPRIHQVVEVLNIPEFAMDGYEADDIIATIAKKAAKSGIRVYVVSSDKDLFQLVDDHISMYVPGRGAEQPTRMDREAVKKKLGVYPEKVIDFLALTGDTSDNVPGIPGVGPKTALSLLDQFGDLEKVLDGAEEISAKGVRAKVSDNKDKALLSQELVTLDCDVPVEFKLDDLSRRDPNMEEAKAVFSELEFFSLLKEFTGEAAEASKPQSAIEEKYHRVETIADLKKLVKKLSSQKEIAFDTETDSLISRTANLVGISLSAKAGEAYYIPIGHSTEPKLNLPPDEVKDILAPLMQNDKVQKIAHNFKYDLQVMERAGYTISPISFDSFLASYVLNPSARGHSLDNLAFERFNHTMIPITDLIGSGKKQKSFATVHPETAAKYACEDADYAYRLRGIFAPELEEKKLTRLYYDIEMPLIPVLSRMEIAGVKIDVDYLGELSRDMEAEMKKVEQGIYTMAGYEFNINSTQQLAKILFEELKLPTKGKTAKKTGYSTDVRVLEELAKMHPLPLAVLEFRRLNKLKSTYIDALPELVDPDTNRVHTTFNQGVAATGRLSSSDPNLQNIPVRTESGREIRRAFIPGGKEYSLLAADYSQIELRILAHFSGDEDLIDAFKHGQDIHTRTASEVFGVALDEVTSAQRRVAKTANFAIIYGVSAYGLSQQTDLSVAQAKQFIDTYFHRYPKIKQYTEGTVEQARRDGYVTTLLGRRRYLPEISSKNRQVREFAERTAINTPVQGTAADLIKMAMIAIDKDLSSMKSRMVLQVHDELVFDAHNDELDKLKKIVEKRMCHSIKLKAPLAVDMGVGPNWLEAK